MADPARELDSDLAIRPDISHLITEDDEPVDNWFQEKQARLLTDSLYASWPGAGQDRPFLAAADVGLFYKVANPALVPDVMVSLDVTPPEEWWEKHNRCYMNWEMGKPPELAIEIVSNDSGTEDGKFEGYARAGVSYFVIFDPLLYLSKRPVRAYTLRAGRYVEVLDPARLEGLDLGLTLWEGSFEGMSGTWLRFRDHGGNLLLTGQERAVLAERKAEQAQQEADRLRQKLRDLGLEPNP